MKTHWRLTASLIRALISSALMTLLSSTHVWANMEPGPSIPDLNAIIALAQKNDFQLKQELESLEVQKIALERSITQFRPQATFTGDITHSQNSIDATGTSDSRHLKGTSRIFALNLSQTLFDLETINTHQQNQVSLEILQTEQLSVLQNFLDRVTRLYLDAILATTDKKLTQKQSLTLKKLHKRAQERFKVGLISVTDVLEAKAQLDNAEVERLQANTQETISRQNLKLITASEHKTLTHLKAATTPFELGLLQDWIKNAQEKSPSLSLAKANLKRAQLQQELAKKAYTPHFSLFGRYASTEGYQSGFDQPDQTSTSLGVRMEVPLYLGGAIHSRRQEASLNLMAQKDALKLNRLTLERDIINLYNTSTTAVARIQAQHSALNSSRKALSATEAGYRSGTRNIVDVLLAQQSLFNAQRSYASARIEAVKALLALNLRAGTLTFETINRFNQRLDRGKDKV